MQPHEQHDGPKRKKPDPRDRQAMWLLTAICIVVGLIAFEVASRFL